MKEIEMRRSIRKYKNQHIEKTLIEQIMNAAMPPSAKNRQPWRFLVLSKEKKEEFLVAMRYGIKQEEQDKKILDRRYFQDPLLLFFEEEKERMVFLF